MHSNNKRWTKEDVNFVMSLHSQGFTADHIAEKAGRSRQAIYCIITRAKSGKLSKLASNETSVPQTTKQSFFGRIFGWLS